MLIQYVFSTVIRANGINGRIYMFNKFDFIIEVRYPKPLALLIRAM